MTRKSALTGSVILLIWVATMGYLWKTHQTESQLPPMQEGDFFQSVELADRWHDIDECMLIMQENSSVGASRSTIQRLGSPDKTSSYEGQLGIHAKFSPLFPAANVRVATQLDDKFNLTKMNVLASLAGLKLSVKGHYRDNLLFIQLDKNGEIKLFKFRLTRPPSLAETIRPVIKDKVKLQPGSKLSSPVLDPFSGQMRGNLHLQVLQKETLSLQGETFEAFRIQSELNGIKSLMWVDAKGETLKRQLPGNYRMERSTSETVIRQAPELAEKLPMEDLDLAPFGSVPVTDPNAGNQRADPALSILGTLIN